MICSKFLRICSQVFLILLGLTVLAFSIYIQGINRLVDVISRDPLFKRKTYPIHNGILETLILNITQFVWQRCKCAFYLSSIRPWNLWIEIFSQLRRVDVHSKVPVSSIKIIFLVFLVGVILLHADPAYLPSVTYNNESYPTMNGVIFYV